jgi:hypothetical protein
MGEKRERERERDWEIGGRRERERRWIERERNIKISENEK